MKSNSNMKKILFAIIILALFSLAFRVISGWLVIMPGEQIKLFCPASAMIIMDIEPPDGYTGRAVLLDCFWITTQ